MVRTKILPTGFSLASKSAKQKRLLELDMLRALAIIMIVIGHTFFFGTTPLFISAIGYLQPYLFFFGLSLFFFVSGFVLYYSYGRIETTADMLTFWKKRLIRLFPLYWLALVSIFVLETLRIEENFTHFSFSSVLIQLLGLQALLAPRFINSIFTLWFVGLILLFYLLYPVIVYPSRDGSHLILASFAVILPFVIMRLAFDIIDFRFFLYYGIFVAGILTCKQGTMYKTSPKPRFLYIGAILLMALLALINFSAIRGIATAASNGALFNGYGYFSYNPSELPLLITKFSLIILLNMVALLFIYVVFIAARLCVPSISRALLNLILIIAFSAYSIYLFHGQILACVDVFVHHVFQLGVIQTDIALILLGYPLILGFAYFVQRGENNVVNRIRNIKKRSAQ